MSRTKGTGSELSNDWRVAAMLRFFESTFRDHRATLKQFARMSRMPAAYLGRLFKKARRETPRRYVFRLRMEVAARLLSNPTTLVKDVAFDLGYYDVANFCSDFKHYCGITPSEWRVGRVHGDDERTSRAAFNPDVFFC